MFDCFMVPEKKRKTVENAEPQCGTRRRRYDNNNIISLPKPIYKQYTHFGIIFYSVSFHPSLNRT